MYIDLCIDMCIVNWAFNLRQSRVSLSHVGVGTSGAELRAYGNLQGVPKEATLLRRAMHDCGAIGPRR